MVHEDVIEKPDTISLASKLCPHSVCECGSQLSQNIEENQVYGCDDVGQTTLCVALNPFPQTKVNVDWYTSF